MMPPTKVPSIRDLVERLHPLPALCDALLLSPAFLHTRIPFPRLPKRTKEEDAVFIFGFILGHYHSMTLYKITAVALSGRGSTLVHYCAMTMCLA